MEISEIPILPDVSNVERLDIEEFFIKEFNTANNKFAFYYNDQNEPRFLFNKLDEKLYASLVYILSKNSHEAVFNFFKLVLEGTRLIKQGTKKGYLAAVRIEKNIPI
jgi:hypothetical protein